MIGYIGKYVVSMDENGRLAIPMKLRQARPIGVSPKKQIKGYVLSEWFEGCLGLFTDDKWVNVIMEVQEEGSVFKKGNRGISRTLASNAYPVKPDGQGRITIPKDLISLADLKDNVLVMGVTTHIEIWDEERFKHFKSDNELAKSAEQLFEKQ